MGIHAQYFLYGIDNFFYKKSHFLSYSMVLLAKASCFYSVVGVHVVLCSLLLYCLCTIFVFGWPISGGSALGLRCLKPLSTIFQLDVVKA
jgi:hypothetical protein